MKTRLLIIISSTLIISFTAFAQNYGVWREIDSMNIARVGLAMVVLPNGNVLVSGSGVDSIQSSSEIYDFATGKWRYTTPMNKPRDSHNLVLLKTGKVLAIGGYKEQSCELFDPDAENWAITDSIPTFRYGGHTVTELSDGKIMVTGGYYVDTTSWDFVILNNVDIYDPYTGFWMEATPMNLGRWLHTATLLSDGRVLVTGGETDNFTTELCEIYNPTTNTWTNVASINEKRSSQAAILLKNGNVFISGGSNDVPLLNTCEIYNVSLNQWSLVGDMLKYRAGHKIYYLSKLDKLLIVGGGIAESGVDTWEIYDPNSLKPIYYEPFPIKQLLKNNNIQITNGNIFVAGGWEYEFNPLPYFWPSKRCWIFDTTTEVDEAFINVKDFQLFQNYPNPFNPITTIGYNLKEQSKVELKIFDILGNEVITLVDDILQAGYHQAEFNTNNLEEGPSSGIYIYQIKARGLGESKTYWQKSNKMILLK